MPIRFGRETAGNLDVAEQLEWLVTNGIGGYGSGTVAATITRGYHGLLVAAVQPPIDRRVMLVKLDETVTYRGAAFDLATNRWASGAVAPQGLANIESFELEGSIPLWRFACAEALIEKRIWMKHGANTTYVAYTVVSAEEPVAFSVRAIVDNRDYNNTGEVAWPSQV
jgi:predicted glycogen debranching enzyme